MLLTLFLSINNVNGQAYFNQYNAENYATLGKNIKTLQGDFDYDGDLDFLHLSL